MHPDHLFSPSALGGSLRDGPKLLKTVPLRFLRRIGSPTASGTRVRAELLPEHHPPPIVVPARDPPGLPPELTALFGSLRDAQGTDATDLETLTAGAITDPSQVRYAPDGELVLALPMVADLPARLGLPNWPKPFGRPTPTNSPPPEHSKSSPTSTSTTPRVPACAQCATAAPCRSVTHRPCAQSSND